MSRVLSDRGQVSPDRTVSSRQYCQIDGRCPPTGLSAPGSTVRSTVGVPRQDCQLQAVLSDRG